MRCPDMRRNIHPLLADFQHHFQKIMTGKAQNGPSVRMDISDFFQPRGKSICLFKSGKQDQAMHLPGFSAFFIDRTDLTRQHKSWRNSGITCRLRQNKLVLQAEQSLFGRNQLLLQFLPPYRMCHISCSKNRDPLFPCPEIQHLRCPVFACCHGISGMYV